MTTTTLSHPPLTRYRFKARQRIVIEQECEFYLELPNYVKLTTAELFGTDYLEVSRDLLRWGNPQRVLADAGPTMCGPDDTLPINSAEIIGYSMCNAEPLPAEDIIPNGIKPQRKGPSQ